MGDLPGAGTPTALLELRFSTDHPLTEMLFITMILSVLSAQGVDRAPPAVVAALRAGSGCFSTVAVTNLSGRELAAEIQARLETGALTPLELVEPASGARPRSEPRREPRGEPRGDPAAAAIDRSERSSILLDLEGLPFAPHERRSFLLGGQREAGDAWVGVWEADPPGTLPALAVEGSIECLAGDRLGTIPRPAALAMRNPWFNGRVADLAGAVMALVTLRPRRPARTCVTRQATCISFRQRCRISAWRGYVPGRRRWPFRRSAAENSPWNAKAPLNSRCTREANPSCCCCCGRWPRAYASTAWIRPSNSAARFRRILPVGSEWSHTVFEA